MAKVGKFSHFLAQGGQSLSLGVFACLVLFCNFADYENASDLYFWLAAGHRVSAKCIGIGTTTPASRLSVSGNLSVGAAYVGTAAPLNGAIIQGSVGIGTSAPDASAGLEVNFTNCGFLPPRVALTSPTDAITIPSPATGLVVYNTNTAGGLTPGLYFNRGTPTSPYRSTFSKQLVFRASDLRGNRYAGNQEIRVGGDCANEVSCAELHLIVTFR